MTGSDIVRWPFRQVSGWITNFTEVVTKYGPTDFLPPTITSTLAWLKQQIPRAFGFGSPGQQLSSSVVLGLAAILTSLFGFGLTVVFVFVFALTFFVGVLRLWPVVDDHWPLGGG